MKASLAFLLLFAVMLLTPVGTARADSIELPWIKQKTATECGRAVLASVAARHGGDVEKLYRKLPPPSDRRRGYSIRQLWKSGAKIGVNLSLQQPEVAIVGECSERPGLAAYFSRLQSLVHGGHPVIVPTGDAAKRGHYLVLVGVTDGTFTDVRLRLRGSCGRRLTDRA
jgi:ABC-type bacteriocin/lantibiotic exporter with double-glycine peptidase domain